MSLLIESDLPALHYGIWKMEETEEQLLALFDDPTLFRQGAAKYGNPSRRVEWLAVRALLRKMLGVDPQIDYLPIGQPVWVDGSRKVSISHTRGYVAAAVSRQDIGIDIEYVSDRIRRVTSRYLRPDEPFARLSTLLVAWTAKEALYKVAHREGLDFQTGMRLVFPPRVLQEQTAVDDLSGIGQMHMGSLDAYLSQPGNSVPVGEADLSGCIHYRLYYITLPEFVFTWTHPAE
jgi:phosphopantetheinyl transferase (holo-ACP synthase)